MNTTLLLNLVLILGGLFILVGAASNWEWLMSRPRTERTIALIGRTGTRILYIVVGLFLIVMGVLTQMGIINPK